MTEQGLSACSFTNIPWFFLNGLTTALGTFASQAQGLGDEGIDCKYAPRQTFCIAKYTEGDANMFGHSLTRVSATLKV
jgi:hypothetical protein